MDIKPQYFRLLTGNAFVFDMLMNGESVPKIIDAWKPELNKFIEQRKKFLIYE
jgi:uncharacterized protein YbbC (DUF1343 family)